MPTSTFVRLLRHGNSYLGSHACPVLPHAEILFPSLSSDGSWFECAHDDQILLNSFLSWWCMFAHIRIERPFSGPWFVVPSHTDSMSSNCARCSKIVYPTEKFVCLDKVWSSILGSRHTQGMASWLLLVRDLRHQADPQDVPWIQQASLLRHVCLSFLLVLTVAATTPLESPPRSPTPSRRFVRRRRSLLVAF
jgi:hypothetical protein